MNYTGKLLIATPSLDDPNFQQSVVLLVQGTDEGGVLGLVLNRVTNQTISSLWKSVFNRSCHSQANLHLGGPVFGPLMSLHACKGLGEIEVIPGIYFTTAKDALENLVDDENGEFRFYVGNAGWSEGQLAREISEGAWYLAEATQEIVFSDETEIWQKLIGSIGKQILGQILQTDRIPDDPSVN